MGHTFCTLHIGSIKQLICSIGGERMRPKKTKMPLASMTQLAPPLGLLGGLIHSQEWPPPPLTWGPACARSLATAPAHGAGGRPPRASATAPAFARSPRASVTAPPATAPPSARDRPFACEEAATAPPTAARPSIREEAATSPPSRGASGPTPASPRPLRPPIRDSTTRRP